jgi:hypothetical protein
MPSVDLAFSHNLLFCLLTDGVSSKYDSENINHFIALYRKTLHPVAKIQPFFDNQLFLFHANRAICMERDLNHP